MQLNEPGEPGLITMRKGIQLFTHAESSDSGKWALTMSEINEASEPLASVNPTVMRRSVNPARLWCNRAFRSPEIVSKFVRSVVLSLRDDEFLICSYLSKGRVGQNWGDKLNPVLVSMISKRPVLNAHDFFNLYDMPIYSVVGSGLGQVKHSNSIIWGHGFARYDDRIRVPPRQVCAVRGPLSRQKLLDSGLQCPAVFGDPALLLPRYFHEHVEKQHRIGLIPHYSHFGLVEFTRLQEQGAEIIDITGDLFDVVRSVKSCSMVASSSLHGVIMADAYGVPSKWLQVEGHPVEDDFRFHDYFKSVGRSDLKAFVVNEDACLADIECSFESYEVKIDLDELYESCPFKPAKEASGSGTGRQRVAPPIRFSNAPCNQSRPAAADV